MNTIQQGSYVIAFDTWKDPYRVNGEIEYEVCLEIIVGKVTNPKSLTFSEAFSLNTYHGSLNFLNEKSTWLNNSNAPSKCIISIDEDTYIDIKEEARVNTWKKIPTYNNKIIFEFVQNVQTHLNSKFQSDTNNPKGYPTAQKAFLRHDFYDSVIQILSDQNPNDLDDLDLGNVGILWETWKTPYNVDGKTVEEESIEIILGKVTNSKPLKLSNTVTLNSYHGSISYSKGSTTWSSGSLSSTKKITVIEGKFLHRLKLELKVKNWGEKPTSYDPKRITKLVRSIENYFSGQFAGKNYKILRRTDLVTGLGAKGNHKIVDIDISAPEIARECEPGQFVV